MEKLHMGRTELPQEVIEEYLESLALVYRPEVLNEARPLMFFLGNPDKSNPRPQSYDLFLNNCNNFTHDLSMFLVGKGIPEHIRALPERFLNTPLGQMLKPQIDMAMRGITQGDTGQDIPGPAIPQTPEIQSTAYTNGAAPAPNKGYVRNVSNLRELQEQLAYASNTCAVIFFTSSTCAPCKIVYPTYDELAAEAGDKAVLIKVDLNYAFDVSSKYGVRATPTFMTFLKGRKENEWSGANASQLRGNVRMLIQMAFPPHPHRDLRLPSLQRKISSYVTYTKVPPFEKLLQKLGKYGADPTITSLVTFSKIRGSAVPADAALPDLSAVSKYIQAFYLDIPQDVRFAMVDLIRASFLDARVSGFFAAEPGQKMLLTILSASKDLASCPYNLRIVMLQLACNLFTTPLYPEYIASDSQLREACTRLLTGCLLDDHTNLRVVAASFAYNLAAFNHNARFEGHAEKLSDECQVELVASLLEAINNESESIEALHGCLFALGLFLYEAPLDGEVVDLCRAMGIADMIKQKNQVAVLTKEPLLKEVGQELIGKGLK